MPGLLASVLAAFGIVAAPPAPALVYERGANTARPSIVVAAADGSGARRIGVGDSPSLAPDRRTVAFVRWNGKTLNLYLIPSFGGKARLLARNTGFGGELRWSPDARRLLAIEGELTQRLVVRDVARGTRTVLARGSIQGYGFSPDGESVVFGRAASTNARVDVFVAPARGGPARRLTRDGRSMFPVWGPTLIAFDKSRRVRLGINVQMWTMRPDGGGARQLTHVKVPNLLMGLVPLEWSRDGSRLLAVFGGQDTSEAYAVDPRTGAARDLSDGWNGVTAFDLSSDGRYVLGQTGGIDSATDHTVVRIPYAGGRSNQLARHASNPSWAV